MAQKPVKMNQTTAQNPPNIAADDIEILNESNNDTSFLGDIESRPSYLSSRGRNQPHEAAAQFPPPHRFVRKAGSRIKFGDESLPQMSPQHLKFLASYRQTTWRQLCEPDVSRPAMSKIS
jgi:hypothetical protein